MQAHNTFVSQTANFGQAKKKAPQVNRMQIAKWAQAGRIGCKICISDADGASGARQEILISRYAAWSLYSKWNDAVDLSQTPKVVFSEAQIWLIMQGIKFV